MRPVRLIDLEAKARLIEYQPNALPSIIAITAIRGDGMLRRGNGT